MKWTHDVSIVIHQPSNANTLIVGQRKRVIANKSHGSYGSINNYNRGQNTIINDYTYAQILFIIIFLFFCSLLFI